MLRINHHGHAVGIGRAVALAFAREGADIAIAYLCEHNDAEVRRRMQHAFCMLRCELAHMWTVSPCCHDTCAGDKEGCGGGWPEGHPHPW